MFVHAKRCAVYFIRSFVKCLSWIILFILIESYRLFVLLRALLVKSTRRGGEVGFNPTSGVRVLHTCTESDDQKRSCEIRFDRTVERRPTMRRKLKPTWLPFDDDTNFNNNNIANTLDRRYRYGNEFYCWKFLDLCSFVFLFFFFIPSYCPFAPFVYVLVCLSFFLYFFIFLFFRFVCLFVI